MIDMGLFCDQGVREGNVGENVLVVVEVGNAEWMKGCNKGWKSGKGWVEVENRKCKYGNLYVISLC